MNGRPDPKALRDGILERAHALGFALCGVARAEASSRRAELERWIADGKHGEMHWLAERVADMSDVRRLLRDARSVVCVADRYHDGRPDRVEPRAARGRIARYARGKDYHDLVRDRLRRLGRFIRDAVPGCQTRLTGDIHPILEREQAARALLGAIGKHTLLIRPGLGSSFLLGEIVTDADIAPSDAPPPPADICGGCTRCIDACPTKAITPWSVDATRCTAYLTIEHRGEIPAPYFGVTGDWWFGCDICQEVCPHGQPTRASRRAGTNPLHAPRRDSVDLLEVLGWTEEDRARLVVSSALKRASLAMMKRNALLALASVARSSPELAGAACARARTIAGDPAEDAIVRAAARQLLAAASPSPRM
jgi:epoxyqueuosine reductase